MIKNLYLPQYVLKKKFGIRKAPDYKKSKRQQQCLHCAEFDSFTGAIKRAEAARFWCVTRERLLSAATCPHNVCASPVTGTVKCGQDVECVISAI